MADLGSVEYRVRPITRYQVTRHHTGSSGLTGGTEQKGEYDNADIAYEVGYALAKEEHSRLGLPPGDERIVYPKHPEKFAQASASNQIRQAGQAMNNMAGVYPGSQLGRV